jgi:hypothetical protein
MGLWGDIKKAVKKVAEAVEDFVNDVGDAVGDAIETVGDAVNDALNWLGDKAGIKPITSWLGGIIKGIFSVLGAVVKGVFGIVGGIIGGLIKIVGGIFTWQGSLILEGIWDIFSPIIGTIIVVIGKVIALVQSIFYLQGFERPLTDEEKEQLKRVFKDSLNYYVIRIIEGHAGLFGLNSRPFVLGNTIYMKTETFGIDSLVHETTHVWQYQQNSNRYASDALAAQWFVPDAYSWEREINLRGKDDWSDFSSEAQAEFFEDLWNHGELRDSSGKTLQRGNGCFFDADGKKYLGYFEVGGNDYTSIANKAVKTVRNEWF